MEHAFDRTAPSPAYPGLALALLACLAIAFPTLIAFNLAPSATFFNQAAAFVGWGGFLLVLGAGLAQSARPRSRGSLAMLASIAILVLAALGASVFAGAPWSLSLSSAGTLVAALLVLAVGACVARAGLGISAFRAFCAAWVVAGVPAPASASSRSSRPTGRRRLDRAVGHPGRAVGNLRQPNHLSSLLLWSAIAVVPWLELGPAAPRPGWALFALMVFAVVLTASRTGVLGVGLLAAWGLLDRRLSRPTRAAAAAVDLRAGLGGLAVWAEASQHAFGGETRLAEADLSGSRFGIWANTWR